MDGKNVDTVLTELGVRFHRLIHEHLQQYSYSSMGGMLAICDVAEYRRCAKDFRVSGRDRGPGCSGYRTKYICYYVKVLGEKKNQTVAVNRWYFVDSFLCQTVQASCSC